MKNMLIHFIFIRFHRHTPNFYLSIFKFLFKLINIRHYHSSCVTTKIQYGSIITYPLTFLNRNNYPWYFSLVFYLVIFLTQIYFL